MTIFSTKKGEINYEEKTNSHILNTVLCFNVLSTKHFRSRLAAMEST